MASELRCSAPSFGLEDVQCSSGLFEPSEADERFRPQQPVREHPRHGVRTVASVRGDAGDGGLQLTPGEMERSEHALGISAAGCVPVASRGCAHLDPIPLGIVPVAAGRTNVGCGQGVAASVPRVAEIGSERDRRLAQPQRRVPVAGPVFELGQPGHRHRSVHRRPVTAQTALYYCSVGPRSRMVVGPQPQQQAAVAGVDPDGQLRLLVELVEEGACRQRCLGIADEPLAIGREDLGQRHVDPSPGCCVQGAVRPTAAGGHVGSDESNETRLCGDGGRQLQIVRAQ